MAASGEGAESTGSDQARAKMLLVVMLVRLMASQELQLQPMLYFRL